MIMLNLSLLTSHERKEGHLAEILLRHLSLLFPAGELRYQCVYLLQLPDQSDISRYRPHDFWAGCLGIIYIYIHSSRARTWAHARLTLLPFRHLLSSFRESPYLLARCLVVALALLLLTISITRMTEWWSLEILKITFIIITMKHYIYAVGIHGGQRSPHRWDLHSALLATSYPRLPHFSNASVFIFLRPFPLSPFTSMRWYVHSIFI